jgi:transcriptional regulator with XRE-family HTH domain
MFQKNEFKAEVVRRGLSLDEVAKAIGINPASLHRKMNGTSDFYRGEIERIIKLLGLNGEDVIRIFFA